MPNPIVHSRSGLAAEGWLPVALGLLLGAGCWWLGWWQAGAALALLTLWLVFLFRDPGRVVPPLPAAVYAPVDGRILSSEEATGADGRQWRHLRIRVSHLGAYTVRAPIEGTIGRVEAGVLPGEPGPGLSLRAEEGDEVVLCFRRRGWLLSPRAFVRFGERLGQGHRFAYLRLAPVAEVYLPAAARLVAAAGDRVRAGETVLGELVAAAQKARALSE